MPAIDDFRALADLLGLHLAEDATIREIGGDFGIRHQIVSTLDKSGDLVWIAASNQALYLGGDWLRKKIEPMLDVGEVRFYMSAYDPVLTPPFIEWPPCHPMQKLPWLIEI